MGNENNVTSVRLDDDVERFRVEECNNFTALVNDLVRRYMQGNLNEQAIKEYRKEELEGQLRERKALLEETKAQLEKLEESPDPVDEEYDKRLEEMGTVAPIPRNTPIKEVAEEFNKDPETVAEDIADKFDKEMPETHDFNY